jgi:hypothetical protein
MEILNAEHRLYFLKSININDQSNTIWMFFRQENFYVLQRDPIKNLEEYRNVLLILHFDDYETTEKHFRSLKEFYLNNSISIDEPSPNVIEFVGDYDLSVTVTKYTEQLIDQSKEDWIDRYLFATKCYFEHSHTRELDRNFIGEIRAILNKFKIDHPLHKAISDKINNFEFSLNPTEDLLTNINRKLDLISEKLNS